MSVQNDVGPLWGERKEEMGLPAVKQFKYKHNRSLGKSFFIKFFQIKYTTSPKECIKDLRSPGGNNRKPKMWQQLLCSLFIKTVY